jgi:hypothetical protein
MVIAGNHPEQAIKVNSNCLPDSPSLMVGPPPDKAVPHTSISSMVSRSPPQRLGR